MISSRVDKAHMQAGRQANSTFLSMSMMRKFQEQASVNELNETSF